MTGGQAYGDEKIGTFATPRSQRTVRNGIRKSASHLDISLVLDHRPAIPVHHCPLTVMGIHLICRHGHPVERHGTPLAVGLRGDIFTNHPPAFTDIELRSPMSCTDILVFRIAPRQHLLPQSLRDAGVVTEEPEQPLRIGGVRRDYRVSELIAALGIEMVHAYHVRGEPAPVVDVRLPARHTAPDEPVIQREFFGTRSHKTDKQFILRRIVIRRTIYGNPVLRAVRQAYAVVVGLHLVITRPVRSEDSVRNAPEQSAFRLARNAVGVDSVRELMPGHELHTVESLSVGLIRLAPDSVTYPGACHQVAFVGAVDEIARPDFGSSVGR